MLSTRISSFASLTIWGGFLCVFGTLLTTHSVEAFAPTLSIPSTTTSMSRICSTSLRSIFGDDREEVVTDGVDLQSFNPLNYQTAKKQMNNIQISLRKMRMQELTGDLLDAVGDEAMTNKILMSFKDFLLEPLNEPDSALEPDSIYTPQMSREERYDAYRSSMDERIEKSKNRGVRSILQSMRDFVLSFEDE